MPSHHADKGLGAGGTTGRALTSIATKRLDKIKGPQVGVPPGDTMLKIVARIDSGLEVRPHHQLRLVRTSIVQALWTSAEVQVRLQGWLQGWLAAAVYCASPGLARAGLEMTLPEAPERAQPSAPHGEPAPAEIHMRAGLPGDGAR